MKNKYGSYIIGGKKIPFKNWEGKEWQRASSNEIWFYAVVLLSVIGYLGFIVIGGYYWL